MGALATSNLSINNDVILGQVVINTFISSLKRQYFFSNMTYDEVVSQWKNPDIQLDGLGLQYREVLGQDLSDLMDAMDSLARASNNKVPNFNSFVIAIRDRAINPSLFQTATFVTVETVKELGTGAQSLGDQLIDTAKILNTLLPFAIIGVIGFIGWNWTKRAAGR